MKNLSSFAMSFIIALTLSTKIFSQDLYLNLPILEVKLSNCELTGVDYIAGMDISKHQNWSFKAHSETKEIYKFYWEGVDKGQKLFYQKGRNGDVLWVQFDTGKFACFKVIIKNGTVKTKQKNIRKFPEVNMG